MSLAKTRKALVAGDLAGAVDAIVAAWRLLPSPRIGAVAVKLSARLPREELPAKVALRDAKWLAIAKARDPRTLPTLLAAEWPVQPKPAFERLSLLCEFPPDPRIADALHYLWRTERYLASEPFWHRAHATLRRWGVADIRQPVVEPPLSPELAADLEALEAATGESSSIDARTRDALFAAVFDDPDADAPRSVLADALLADGDPRGELIALQLAGERKHAARIAALLRTHAPVWLGDLDGLIAEPVFRRGFVEEATLPDWTRLDPSRRGWRTVRALHIERYLSKPATDVLAAFAHDNLACVRHVDGLPSDALWPLLEQRAFEHVGIEGSLPRTSSATPCRVRELGIDDVARRFRRVLTWIDRLPELGLEAIVLDCDEQLLVKVWRWFEHARVQRVTLRPMYIGPIAWELALAKPRGTLAIAATWHGNLYQERSPEGLGAMLRGLPLASFSCATAIDIDDELRERLAADLRLGLPEGLAPTLFAT